MGFLIKWPNLESWLKCANLWNFSYKDIVKILRQIIWNMQDICVYIYTHQHIYPIKMARIKAKLKADMVKTLQGQIQTTRDNKISNSFFQIWSKKNCYNLLKPNHVLKSSLARMLVIWFTNPYPSGQIEWPLKAITNKGDLAYSGFYREKQSDFG